jgi:hypothetical protein
MIENIGKFNPSAIAKFIVRVFMKMVMIPVRIFMLFPPWLRGLIFFIFLSLAAYLLWWYIKNKDAYLRVRY